MNNGKNIIDTAVQFLGTPYLWGGSSPDGFDCSGLTQYVYNQNGVTIPRTANEQFNSGSAVDYQNLQAGDLVFFKGYKKDGSAGHVGIYVGNGEYLHAPKTGDVVKISSLSSRSDYLGARRYANTEQSITTEKTGWWEETKDSFWTSVTKILAIIFLVIIAVVFFMKAFEII